MITFGPHNRLRSRASWHDDQALNRRQAALLTEDVLATRLRLTNELLVARFGPGTLARPDLLERVSYVVDANPRQPLTWVIWTEPKAKRGTAIAVFDHPVTRVEGRVISCEWHFCAIGLDQN
jgi:hypothetical protein